MTCPHDHTILQADRLWCRDCRTYLPLDVFVQNEADLMALIVVLDLQGSVPVQEPRLADVIHLPTRTPDLTPAG